MPKIIFYYTTIFVQSYIKLNYNIFMFNNLQHVMKTAYYEKVTRENMTLSTGVIYLRIKIKLSPNTVWVETPPPPILTIISTIIYSPNSYDIDL